MTMGPSAALPDVVDPGVTVISTPQRHRKSQLREDKAADVDVCRGVDNKSQRLTWLSKVCVGKALTKG